MGDTLFSGSDHVAATRKLRALIPVETVTTPSDAALGDWYVNRIVVDRRPLLLLVSSASLLSMLLPARDVRGLPQRLASLVASRLRRCDIDDAVVAAEEQAMRDVVIAPTVDRSVLGTMVDFATAVPCYLDPGQWTDETLASVEDRLAGTPCHASLSRDRVVFPEQKAPELLRAKWQDVSLRSTPNGPPSVR